MQTNEVLTVWRAFAEARNLKFTGEFTGSVYRIKLYKGTLLRLNLSLISSSQTIDAENLDIITDAVLHAAPDKDFYNGQHFGGVVWHKGYFDTWGDGYRAKFKTMAAATKFLETRGYYEINR